MTTQPDPAEASNVQELRSLEDDVATYLEITERMEELGAQLAAVRHRLADRGVGTHETGAGIKVTVSAPNRTFNLEKAWSMLTDEQRSLCQSRDAAKVKKQLPGVLVDECMEAGTGTPRVVVK